MPLVGGPDHTNNNALNAESASKHRWFADCRTKMYQAKALRLQSGIMPLGGGPDHTTNNNAVNAESFFASKSDTRPSAARSAVEVEEVREDANSSHLPKRRMQMLRSHTPVRQAIMCP
jgi:hypothetical protein